MSDEDLRALRRKLCEDGHADIVRWVERLGVQGTTCRHGTLDPPMLYPVEFQIAYQQLHVYCQIPANVGLRDAFEWCGASIQGLTTLSRKPVVFYEPRINRALELPADLLMGDGREPSLSFRPRLIYPASTVSVTLECGDEPSSGAILLHGRWVEMPKPERAL